jgi:hypothetical protein
MSTAAVMNMGIGSECWDAGMYETVGVASHTFAAVSQVSGAVNSGLKHLSIAWDLRKLNVNFSNFLDNVYKTHEDARNGVTKFVPATREELETSIRSLEYLYETMSRLYTTSQKKRLTNNSLMAGSLANIHRRSEELLDIADWFRIALSSSNSELDSIFASARADLAEGNVFNLS